MKKTFVFLMLVFGLINIGHARVVSGKCVFEPNEHGVRQVIQIELTNPSGMSFKFINWNSKDNNFNRTGIENMGMLQILYETNSISGPRYVMLTPVEGPEVLNDKVNDRMPSKFKYDYDSFDLRRKDYCTMQYN